MNGIWRQIFLIVLAGLVGALGGGLTAWRALDRIEADTVYLRNQVHEHRELDGHGYVLRLLPGVEAIATDHQRRLMEIDKRIYRIESNRYTNIDGERDRRLLEVRVDSVVERINRLERLWEKHRDGKAHRISP